MFEIVQRAELETVEKGLPLDHLLPIILRTQKQAREGLWYDRKSPIDQLDVSGRTNCIGYTIKGSEALERESVEHYVGVLNGHATTVAPLAAENGTRLWLVDMLSPELNSDISEAIEYSSSPLEGISSELAVNGRVLMIVEGGGIGPGSHYSRDKLIEKHPWLQIEESNIWSSLNSFSRSQKLILTLFEPIIGREVIYHYAKFLESAEDKPEQAAESLKLLAGVYPDIDIRGSSPKLVKSVVRRLAHGGKVDEAVAAVGYFFDSFGPSTDTRVAEYKADCLRAIAKVRGTTGTNTDARDLLEQARDLYRGVVRRPQAYRSVLGKLAACDALLAQATS